ncbi:MAG: hydrogenase 3 maturation endopeptidase HyCI [Thermodesulfovibrionaceae bacterium]
MELREFLNNIGDKTLIVGVGNPLRGDDAVGSYIVKSINKDINIPLIDCEDAPERYLEKIIQYKPETIIFIDAVEMGIQPGYVCIISDRELESLTILTHKVSLKLLAKYIKSKIQCNIVIIGIQPKNKDFGSTMSKEVMITAKILREILVERFKK